MSPSIPLVAVLPKNYRKITRIITFNGHRIANLPVIGIASKAVKEEHPEGQFAAFDPVFIAAETFRMGGHATHDVREARDLLPPEVFDYWGRRDPIGLYEEYLASGPWDLAAGAAEVSIDPDLGLEDRNRRVLSILESELVAEVDAAAARALESRDRETADTDEETERDVYA